MAQADRSGSPRQPPGDQDATDVLGANAACLVCHLTFVKEELAKTISCKGSAASSATAPSVGHANDEHIGATKPDITYPRDKVDACVRQVPRASTTSPPRKVIARFLERKLPRQPAPICTDCHGHAPDRDRADMPGSGAGSDDGRSRASSQRLTDLERREVAKPERCNSYELL